MLAEAVLAAVVTYGSADTIDCPAPQPIARESRTERAPAALANLADALPRNVTRASDPIRAAWRGARWFPSTGGRDGGSSALFSSDERLYAACSRYDGARGIELYEHPLSPIPAYVPRVKTGAIFGTRALRFGATPEDVARVYGPARLVNVTGALQGVRYDKDAVGEAHATTSTSFFFHAGRLIGIYRIVGV